MKKAVWNGSNDFHTIAKRAQGMLCSIPQKLVTDPNLFNRIITKPGSSNTILKP